MPDPMGAAMWSPVAGKRGALGAVIAKAFWVWMLVCHTPAWIGAWASLAGDEPRLPGCVGLTLTQAFFVLKLIDVRWLRFRADRRTTVGLVAVIALLHAGVLERAVGRITEAELTCEAAVLSGGLAAVASVLVRAVCSVEQRRRRSAVRRMRAVTELVLSAFRQAFLPPRYLLLERACLLSRAPPR